MLETMKRVFSILITLSVSAFSILPIVAQINVPTGYKLVYSSETPQRASTILNLTDEELANCTGDFLNKRNFERNWEYSKKATSTWNKRMATTDEERALVHKPTGGHLRLLAVTTNGKADGFITSGVNMKKAYKYGIFEMKAKCNPHASNFPAIWMMPEDTSDGWPNCGEIDIMEQIGNSSTVYSTVHLGARYDKSVGKTYAWSGSKNFNTDYHIYSLLWDKESITFYTDGIQVFQYKKDTTLDLVKHPDYEKWQFPYNKAFYVILDQALGMNEWWGSQDPDPSYTYEMDVEYVRIFQCEDEDDMSSNIESYKGVYEPMNNYRQARKFMRNGKIVIEAAGKKYAVTGQQFE